MKKSDLVKAKDYQFINHGVGIILATDQLGCLKVYWPTKKCWCITSEKALKKI